MIEYVNWSSYNVPVILSDIRKLTFSRQIFEKNSNIKFEENRSSGSRVVPCRQTDGETW